MEKTTMVILTGQDLELKFGTQIVLDNANLAIEENERIGVLGKNGAGKSSLLKILSGKNLPDDGTVTRRKNLSTFYIAQECPLDLEKSVLENIRDGAKEIFKKIDDYEKGIGDLDEIEHFLTHCDGWDIENNIKIFMQKLNVPNAEKLCKNLSGGERRRVGICQSLVSHPELLLLDEPTNHLDVESIQWLENFLRIYNGTVIFITHDRFFLDRIATRIIEVEKGQIFSYDGNYSAYLVGKSVREELLEIKEQKRQSFIRREIDWIRAGVKARTTKSKSRIGRFEEAANAKFWTNENDVELIIPPPPKLGNIILEIQDLTLERSGKKLFENLDIIFEQGMCLGIVGKNGVGKSSLIKTILGELKPTSGNIKIGQNTVFNYIDQERFLLDENKTVQEEVTDGKEFVMLGDHKLSAFTYLKRFLFSDERIRQNIAQLSGGEKNRLLLAKQIKYGGNFLILDEPTNDLDLSTLSILESALAEFYGCSIVISHDRYFLNHICTHLLVFEEDKFILLEGNYDYYLQKKTENEASKNVEKIIAKNENSVTEKSKKSGLNYHEKKEFSTIEERIAEEENNVRTIENLLNSPDFFDKNNNNFSRINAELELARKTVADLYAKWEFLSEKNG